MKKDSCVELLYVSQITTTTKVDRIGLMVVAKRQRSRKFIAVIC